MGSTVSVRWSCALAGGVVLSTLAGPGCTLINQIDVCERREAVEHELNARTEGTQRLGTPRAVAALPAGGALVTFVSSISGDPDEVRTEVRGVLVSPDGSPMPTCEQPGELTYAESADREIHNQPSVVPPETDDGIGLLVYSMDDGSSMQVYARPISATACPYGTTGPVQVSLEQGPPCAALRSDAPLTDLPDFRCAASPVAARLSDSDFVVLWLELESVGHVVRTSVRARVLRARFTTLEFLPTVGSATGEPVDLGDVGRLVTDMTAEALGEGRFVVLWHETETDAFRTAVRTYDDRLGPLDDPRTLRTAPGDVPDSVGLDAAFDGERLLAAWIERDEAGVSRAVASLMSGDAAPLGDVFRLGATASGEESGVSVSARRGGGFVAAWAETGAAGRGDRSGSGLRAVALASDGAVLFANRACDRADFQLNQATGGDQLDPSLVELVDGSLVAAWTDAGQNGVDRSLASIRAIALTPYELFPIEQNAEEP
jgi:hypothetical protein